MSSALAEIPVETPVQSPDATLANADERPDVAAARAPLVAGDPVGIRHQCGRWWAPARFARIDHRTGDHVFTGVAELQPTMSMQATLGDNVRRADECDFYHPCPKCNVVAHDRKTASILEHGYAPRPTERPNCRRCDGTRWVPWFPFTPFDDAFTDDGEE
ncbi:MAG TPA: hypothetical protein VK636_14745, partial [Gemmatimonadaceae bacterium]|nr:hypothetical protein [Gemmatimonadaceae bacterium]